MKTTDTITSVQGLKQEELYGKMPEEPRSWLGVCMLVGLLYSAYHITKGKGDFQGAYLWGSFSLAAALVRIFEGIRYCAHMTRWAAFHKK